MNTSRRISADVLSSFDVSYNQLPEVVDQVFNKYGPSLSKKQRSRVIINEVIRRRGILDHIIEKCSSKKIDKIQPKLRAIIRIGCYELLFDDFIPDFAAIHSAVELGKKSINKKAGSMVNAVLRNIQREQKKDSTWLELIINNNPELAYPNWLIKKWKRQFGSIITKKLCVSFFNKAPMFLRVNEELLEKDKSINFLKKSGISIKQHKAFSNFLEVTNGQDKVLDTDLFGTGMISIQDPASGAVVDLIDPQKGESILDVCAAPGTKSLFMAQRVGPNGTIYASDNNENRVKKGKADIKRHKYNNIKWTVLDATKDEFPLSKKILIDAPCTGTGVLGRRPDIKWRIKNKDINSMNQLQLTILNHMSNFLIPGGRIVYATCSLEPEENIYVVKQFLSKHRDFTLAPSNSFLPKHWVDSDGLLMTMPYITKSDGLFGAVLLKKE